MKNVKNGKINAVVFCANNIVEQDMGEKEKYAFLRWCYDRFELMGIVKRKHFYDLVNLRIAHIMGV